MKIYLYLFVILFLCSCANHSSKKKIGFLIRTQTLDRCVKEKGFFTEKISELGAEVIIYDANNNDQLQISQAEEILKNGVDVLVVFPVNGQTSSAIVREAHKYKVPVIAYESLIENCDLDYFITADNRKGGELMAQYIIKKYPQGDYVLLGGDKADNNAVLIKEGQRKALESSVKSGQIIIKYDVYADWNASEGYFETNKYLTLSNNIPAVLLCSNDGLATGAAQAIKEKNLTGEVGITGLDGELSAFQRIARGEQSMTIFKSFKKQAYVAAEMAYNLAIGKKYEAVLVDVFNKTKNVPSILLEPVVIDKENLDEIIIKPGVYTSEAIYSLQ